MDKIKHNNWTQKEVMCVILWELSITEEQTDMFKS